MRSFIISIVFLWIVSPVYADLRINEIYPAPESGQFEWVELYNDSPDEVSLSDFNLADEKNNQLIFEVRTVGGNNYAIATASGVLNNGGDTVYLKKTNGDAIDTRTYSDGFDASKSYVRCPDENNWMITHFLTRGSENTQACTVTLTPSSTPTPPPPIESFASFDLYISEIMAYPEDENEWVELSNKSDSPASLHGWYLDDTENGGASPRQFNLEIGPKQFAVYELPSSMFNNDGDSVRLIDPNGNQKERLTFPSSAKGKSWGKTDPTSSALCLQNTSKGISNESCITPTSHPTSPTPTQKMATSTPTTHASASATLTKSPTLPATQSARLPTHPHASQGAYLLPSVKNISVNVLGAHIATPSATSDRPRKITALISVCICVLTIIVLLVKIKK